MDNLGSSFVDLVINLVISLERIHGYIANEQEAKPTPGGVPSAYWPASGALTVEKLSAKYSQTGPKVLQDISFKINSGERIGVGKFQLYFPERFSMC